MAQTMEEGIAFERSTLAPTDRLGKITCTRTKNTQGRRRKMQREKARKERMRTDWNDARTLKRKR